ncbi:hypothetical protein [Roseovarius indicus]|uniref:hypothetical protein n=1 Tax=Roseovarius indicus TaxID=540747 RepID=UPI0007D9B717|nr:hypothetical protein [Roseovarius indicus]OAO05915.1 hypothetical protein A8B76_11980 [Roseovarius indicus]
MAYESKPMGNRLGLYADKVEAKRAALGLDDKGFRLDGDAAGADKEAMEREMYRCADAHLPPGIGGTTPADTDTTEEEGQEDGNRQ